MIKRFKFPALSLRLGGTLKILIAGVVLVFVGYNLFFVYVRPDEYGIKVARVGINRGVQKKIYQAGLNFVLPFGLQQIYRLPKGIQVLVRYFIYSKEIQKNIEEKKLQDRMVFTNQAAARTAPAQSFLESRSAFPPSEHPAGLRLPSSNPDLRLQESIIE